MKHQIMIHIQTPGMKIEDIRPFVENLRGTVQMAVAPNVELEEIRNFTYILLIETRSHADTYGTAEAVNKALLSAGYETDEHAMPWMLWTWRKPANC